MSSSFDLMSSSFDLMTSSFDPMYPFAPFGHSTHSTPSAFDVRLGLDIKLAQMRNTERILHLRQ